MRTASKLDWMDRREFLKASLFLGSLPLWGRKLLQAAEPKGKGIAVSGRYPHLAVFNHQGECGIGAVVAWAGRLWFVTYSPHRPNGSDDGLYEITPALEMKKHPESIGGTPANRMIHAESDQLFIGPYAIDSNRNVRAIPYERMPGRPTGNARHLTDPAGKLYYLTMEEGMYEVDVRSLTVKTLYPDANTTSGGHGGDTLPGYHGKGAYTAQGRVVYANNGEYGAGGVTDPAAFAQPSGCLAEWDGKQWEVHERTQFTDVTGPGGIRANPSTEAPLWTIGWDHRSLVLKLLDEGTWYSFRLPKGDYSYEGLHGWFTEWPRIRQVGPNGEYLMNMHGMWFDFPGDFSKAHASAPAPIGCYLKMTADFARWQDRIVFGCDDAARSKFGHGESLVGQSQSNIWFATWEGLHRCGRPAGWGGLWAHDDVRAETPSDPFLLRGFDRRQLHLTHNSEKPITFTIEIDRNGDGDWEELETVWAPIGSYRRYAFEDDLKAEWIRLKTDRDAKDVTAYCHFGYGGGAITDTSIIRSIASADPATPRSLGLVRPRGEDHGTLQFAAWTVDRKGGLREAGYYEMDKELNLKQVQDKKTHELLKEEAAIGDPQFLVDEASVVVPGHDGERFRLPKGDPAFDEPTAFGRARDAREVVTERELFNAHGTIYWLPRPNSGGVRRLKPVCTHNCRIVDFCSWRGMLVITGCRAEAEEDGHFFADNDGKVGLWLGDVDDLWQFGKPRGVGGPWKETRLEAAQVSDPYLMTGYDKKRLELSHHSDQPVTFTLEIDFLADGTWVHYEALTVFPNQTLSHDFPSGLGAHWARLRPDRPCRATATFIYT